ncbi:MAG: phosphoglycerate kinase [Oscillospiraceae bacterium]
MDNLIAANKITRFINAVVGGGDSVTAANKYGKTDLINYICTGGGAMIQFLTGKELPVVKALRSGATI